MADFFVQYANLLAIGGMAVVFLIWIIVLQKRLNRVKNQLNQFCTGKSGKNLEGLIVACSEGVSEVESKLKELFQDSRKNREIALGAVQKIGLVRYNPFQNTGGDQSFSAAFLNDSGDGIVITSLYTREGTRVYAKSVKGGVSESKLSEEETKVVEKSLKLQV